MDIYFSTFYDRPSIAVNGSTSATRVFLLATDRPEQEVAEILFKVMETLPQEVTVDYAEFEPLMLNRIRQGLKDHELVAPPVGSPPKPDSKELIISSIKGFSNQKSVQDPETKCFRWLTTYKITNTLAIFEGDVE